MLLSKLNPRDSTNAALIERLRSHSSELKQFESFLEAGPQFVLQLSLVLRAGHISKFFLLAMVSRDIDMTVN